MPGTGMRGAGPLGSLVVLALAGCIRVDPRPDYQRVGQLITERTGVVDVYDPLRETETLERVRDLAGPDLTVAGAVRIALLNNAGLQAQFALLGAARADVVQSGLWTNPSFSLAIQVPDGSHGVNRIASGLSQQIADLWQIPVRRKIAEAELERTLLDVGRRGIELVAQVRTSCYRLLALQENARALAAGRALAQRSLGLAEAQFQAGEVARIDLNLARAALVDTELELAANERECRVATATLGQLLGLSRWEGARRLVDTLPAPGPAAPDDAELIAAALEQRLDVRAALRQMDAAEQEVVRQYLRIVPDLSLSAEFERLEQRTLPGRKVLADTVRSSLAAGRLTLPTVQSPGERRLELAQRINTVLGPGITITVPIWDQNQAQIAKARLVAVQRRKELEELLDRVASDVQQAAAALQNAAALVAVYERDALPQAQETLELSRELYRQGEQGILVVLEGQASHLRRQRAYVDARRDYAVALATLEQALGARLADLQATAEPAASMPASAPADN